MWRNNAERTLLNDYTSRESDQSSLTYMALFVHLERGETFRFAWLPQSGT